MPENNANITDQELLDRFYRDHDNSWLGILFERYTLLLFGLCMKYLKNEEEAKDAVQQVFLKAITELHKYPVQFFKSWLYMVAKNHCLMKLRERQGKVITEINEDLVTGENESITLAELLEKDKQLEVMTESIDELNDEQKQCVTLFYLDRRSYQQIVETTGFTMMQVKSYIQNGKRNLKLIMEKKMKRP